ncbi:hypothetical protein [Orenia marismortui]|uniref:YD repeat-containing protein n=1 Tax=Orenia marismortui TaxID=46469 RepID=A0A4R8H205_9FIRM|nr:hypothetical protein [Orenia marismortui]TDX52343.1 hypothetical protein C7959_10751 [Orenia marismortui]
MSKRLLSLLVIPILITSLFSSATLAKKHKGKKFKNKGHKKKFYSKDKDTKFLTDNFKVEQEKIDYFSRLGLSSEEMSLVFYLYSASNRPITKSEISFIVKNKADWSKLAWYFGVPPIILEDGILRFKHSSHSRLSLPLGRENYSRERRGRFNEKISSKKNKYEYTYEDKRLAIQEKIEIKKNKYEYKYENKHLGIIERLEVKYPANKYEYFYYNRNTGERIKKSGRGKPFNPSYFYSKLKEEKEEKDNNINFSVNIDIEL